MEAVMTPTYAPTDWAGGHDQAAQLALRCFECLPRPTLLLHPNGAIARINAAGQRLLLERHCLRIGYGRMTGFAGEASERFDDALARAMSGRVSRVVVTLFEGGAQIWQVELAPMRIESPPPSSELLLMLTVHAPVRPERGIVALTRIFKLTCAEARVLALLAEDRTPAEIGATLGVSVTTVRTHLQSLYQKTGSRRQPELVRLALLAASS